MRHFNTIFRSLFFSFPNFYQCRKILCPTNTSPPTNISDVYLGEFMCYLSKIGKFKWRLSKPRGVSCHLRIVGETVFDFLT